MFRAKFYTGDFAVIKTEIVGPKVGKALQRQALSATLYALGGMLVPAVVSAISHALS